MKVLLLNPHDGFARELTDLSCAIKEIRIVDGEASDLWLGSSPADIVDAIVGAGDIITRRDLVDSLLKWRTHLHSSLVPCWVASEFNTFERGCLWPRLSIDRFRKQMSAQDVCDWLIQVAEWQQTRMHLSQSSSLRSCGPLEIVNSLALRRATGRLHVFDNDGEEGTVLIQQGCLVNAKVKHLSSEEAFFEFFSWNSGSYLWEPLDSGEGVVANQALQSLIEEGLKWISDANIIFNFIPDLHCRIERTESESALDDGAAHSFNAKRKIYNLINGPTSVTDLIHASSLSQPRVMGCFAKWFSLGDIRVSEGAAHPPEIEEVHLDYEDNFDLSADLEIGSNEIAFDFRESGEPLEELESDLLALFDEFEEPAESLGPSESRAVEREVIEVSTPEKAGELSEDAAISSQGGMVSGIAGGVAFAPEQIGAVPEFVREAAALSEEKGAASEVAGMEARTSDEVSTVSEVVGTSPDESSFTPIRLLIVDDSRFMCIALQNMFSNDPRFQILGTGHDGLEALKLISQLKPDVVTLDMQMPRMDGLTALKHIMIRDPKPVVVLSAFTKETSQLTYESFKYGAVDVLTKPARGSMKQEGMEADKICDRVAEAAGVRLEAAQYIRRGRKSGKAQKGIYSEIEINQLGNSDRSVFVMCCGMGGFPALLKFLFSISELDNLPPIVTCISMTGRAVEALVPNLQKDCDMEFEVVSTAADLKSGSCYLFSHEYCCHVSGNNGRIRIEKGLDCQEHRPFDHLLTSVGESCGERSIALLLSGAGNDGFEGIRAIQQGGGLTSVLSPELCLKPDLPRKVLNDRLAREVKTPKEFIRLMENHRNSFLGE